MESESHTGSESRDVLADLESVPLDKRPKHVAVIMDGNGRWAQLQGRPRVEGHLRGVQSVRTVMEACEEFGVGTLTLYCLSSENWKRPAQELEFLLALLKEYLIAERENLVKNNIRLRIIGQRARLPDEVQHEMDETLRACEQNTGMLLCLAINYGARAEIVDAVQVIVRKAQAGELSAESVDEALISSCLYTDGVLDPDLLIRTSGEMRISNFLLWQISYAEIWVTETLWPEFGRESVAEAIVEFAKRKRRFGGLDGGVEQ